MLKIVSVVALGANVVWLCWIGYAWVVNGFRPQMWQDVLVAVTPLLSIVSLSTYALTSGRGLMALWVEKKRGELKRQIDDLK